MSEPFDLLKKLMEIRSIKSIELDCKVCDLTAEKYAALEILKSNFKKLAIEKDQLDLREEELNLQKRKWFIAVEDNHGLDKSRNYQCEGNEMWTLKAK